MAVATGDKRSSGRRAVPAFLGRISVNGLQTLGDVDDDSCEGEAYEERGTVCQKANESK